jgi:hypothetical protein
MNNYEEIKSLIDASRKALSKKSLNEIRDIKISHGLLKEQPTEEDVEKVDVDMDVDIKKPKMFGQEEMSDQEKRTFKIKGNTISIYGNVKSELQLTLDEKVAFQESVDEFRTGVAELVDFNIMNVYQDNVEWSGLITDRDIEFFFSVSETDGVYIKGEMIKVDTDFMELTENLKKFYEKFKAKWSKIIASRKETKK